jgi:SAM-dependent methyltransferase
MPDLKHIFRKFLNKDSGTDSDEKVVFRDFGLLQQLLHNYNPNTVNRIISQNDTMRGDNYISVGASAVEVIITACAVANMTKVNRVLDLPCGHGRVLRHLVHLFPKAEFSACDLDADGVSFCASTFGARPIYSKEDLTTVQFDSTYDLIWIGSLFTHTSYEITKKWLQFLSTLLSHTGIIVATFHGRWAAQLHRLVPYLNEEYFQMILADYKSKGYGYHDYKKEESHEFISGNYGISVAKPHVLIEILEGIPNTRIYMYQEKAWAHNHDVAVFGRPDWDESHW